MKPLLVNHASGFPETEIELFVYWCNHTHQTIISLDNYSDPRWTATRHLTLVRSFKKTLTFAKGEICDQETASSEAFA